MILEVENGCFGYPKQEEILTDINIKLEEGHILSVLGPNGIGKTTLLKCMIGLMPWSRGRSLLTGKDIRTLKSKEIWNMISYIPQTHGFSFSYTGLEMVMLGRSSHLGLFSQPGHREIEMAEAMMEKVGITRLADKDCNRMSGGELQMVLVEKLAHEENIGAIMNTHYPTNAMSIADEALMMNRKGDRFYGPTGDILNESNISKSFDVNVVVDEIMYQNRTIRSVVPVSLA